jgi:hypothetical protein
MADAYQLRELHDTYVWEINAAIGEDRIDLVWQLADDYMDRALRLISAGESPACDVPDCTICARAHHPRPMRRPRRWFRSAG